MHICAFSERINEKIRTEIYGENCILRKSKIDIYISTIMDIFKQLVFKRVAIILLSVADEILIVLNLSVAIPSA